MRTLKNFFISCGVLLLACLLAFGGWQLFGPVSSPSEVKVVANTPKHLQLTALGDSLTYGVGDATNNGVAFQKRLATLLTTIRKENPTAPIYVFGIYNPFYVYFPKMTAMTNSVKAWNQATQKTLQQFDRTYYVDIDSVLSNGETAANKASAKEALKEATSGDGNPLIFSQDHFHPNNAGYGQMTKQLMKQMKATKKAWE